MTNLNYNELLQAEIDKVQGYVDSKEVDITVKEETLKNDKAQLSGLKFKLKDLLDKKAELEEFEEWKNNKALAKNKSTKAKEGKVELNEKGANITAEFTVENTKE